METTRFLNVDLDLSAPNGLLPLVRALQPTLISLRASDKDVTLELAKQPEGVGEAIDGIAREVERLPASLRSIWDSCSTREMNVGLAAGREPHETHFLVPLASLSRLAAIGADLVFTVYGSKGPGSPPATARTKPRAKAGRQRAMRSRRPSKR